MRIKVLKGFRHDAKYVEPGSIIDVPTPDGRVFVARGKAEEYHEEKPKKAKREYTRRDMVAEAAPVEPAPVVSEPVPAPEPPAEEKPEPAPLRAARRWNYRAKDQDE